MNNQDNDYKTAEAFATSWTNLPRGSIYTFEQFEDWLSPLTSKDFENKEVLEMGCGNASLLIHATQWNPSALTGIDLGDSVLPAQKNMQETGYKNYLIRKEDLIKYRSKEKYDLVYSIGVLHHLKEPAKGFASVIENTKPGGNFHCWVYAKEGNSLIRNLVDPIRKITSSLPWWFTKYFAATPLSFFYFLYAHFIVNLHLSFLPLYLYSKWICKRNFLFFRHVAFDQLVTPQTSYISREVITKWIESEKRIDKNTTYIIFRNGNSWKFGGKTISIL